MAIIACSECGKEISTLATTCPNCGAPAPAKIRAVAQAQSAASNKAALKLLVFLVVIGWPIWKFYQAYQSDQTWNTAHPGKVRDTNGNPVDPVESKPKLDFAQPLYLKTGYPLCTTSDEVDVWLNKAPSRCLVVKNDVSVVSVDSSGLLWGKAHVRMMDTRQIIDGYTLTSGLRN